MRHGRPTPAGPLPWACTRPPTRRGPDRTALLAVALAILSAAPGCTGSSETPRTVSIEADDSVPSESLQDWVSYADQISILSLESERPTDTSADPAVNGGYFGRIVTARVVQTLWSRAGAPSTPDRFDMVVAGWMGADKHPVSMTAPFDRRLRIPTSSRWPVTNRRTRRATGGPSGLASSSPGAVRGSRRRPPRSWRRRLPPREGRTAGFHDPGLDDPRPAGGEVWPAASRCALQRGLRRTQREGVRGSLSRRVRVSPVQSDQRSRRRDPPRRVEW